MSQTPKRRVNRKAVLILTAAAAALGVTVHLVHGFQIRRHAPALLEQAAEQEREGQLAQAADTLSQYLGMVPSDTDALARYGLLLGRRAKTGKDRLKAFFVLEQVLRRDGERRDIRRRVARLATEMRRFQDARHHLEVLQGNEDAELLQLQGRCEAADDDIHKAAECYEKAVEKAPGRVEICLEYADLLRRRLELPKEADAVVEKMVQANPRARDAQLAAARYYRQFGAWAKAEKAVRFALDELKAEDVEVFHLAAGVAEVQGKAKEARDSLERGLKKHPDSARLGLQLARLEVRAGRTDEALRLLQPTLKELPDDLQQLIILGDLLVDLERPDDVDVVVKRLRQAWAGGYLRARLLTRRGAWGEARQILERVRFDAPVSSAASRQLELLLARCYERLGNPDQQLRAARRALGGDLGSLPARLTVASALARLGKADEAIREYRLLAEQAPQVRPVLAGLLLGRNLRLPAADRRWDEIDSLLKSLPANADTELLQAQALLVRGKAKEALARVEAERKRDPKQVRPWLYLISRGREQGNAVLPLVDEAEKHTGPRVEWELIRARHWASASPVEAKRALAKVADKGKQFGGAERDRLLLGLGQAFLEAGDGAGAARLWRELAERRPGDLSVRLRLLEMAYQEGQGAELDRLLGEVRRIEGAGGALAAYGEAARLLVRVRGGERSLLAEAHRLLTEAGKLRPSWSVVPLLQAQAHELEERADKALERYQAALDRGEGRLGVVRRVVQLLFRQKRYAEAQALLGRTSGPGRALGGLDRMSMALTMLDARGEGEGAVKARQRAVQEARKAVAADSKDYRDYLWLGQVHLAAGQVSEAEASLRRARDLADGAPDAWAALVLMLARTAPKKTEAELEAARKRLAGDKLYQVLAPGYEALGRLEEAEKQHQAAAKERPDDPAVLRGVAGFYVRAGQAAKAEPFLRRLLAPRGKVPEETATWARRLLAINLAWGGNYRQFQEALALLPQREGEPMGDRQARALVLATRPERRHEAIRLFEGFSSGKDAAAPERRFLLARLYEADGNWSKARSYFRALVAEEDKNPVYLAAYVRARLRHKEADDAESLVDRLAKLDRQALEVVELRARVRHANGKSGEARDLVRQYARQKGARLDLAALLLEQLGHAAEAGTLYRAHLALGKDPLARLRLAQNLARRGRVAEALGQCEAAWAVAPPGQVGGVSVSVLRAPEATARDQERVDRWLRDSLGKYPKSVGLAVALAELEELRGRYDRAMEIYRGLARQSPPTITALNNLAYLLALKEGRHAEALRLIQAAIAEAGPHPILLDTRGLIYLTGKQASPALGDLRQAVQESPSASIYFHLAQAHVAAEDRPAAWAAYRKATQLGLRERDLPMLERDAFRRFADDLKDEH